MDADSVYKEIYSAEIEKGCSKGMASAIAYATLKKDFTKQNGKWIPKEEDLSKTQPGNVYVDAPLENISTAPQLKKFNITKFQEDQQLVFGWCMISQWEDGTEYYDYEGDGIDPQELETMAYNYVLNFGDVDLNHEYETLGRVVESVVTTLEKQAALGITNPIPVGWFIGLKIQDDQLWQDIKSGVYESFSIGGQAERNRIDSV